VKLLHPIQNVRSSSCRQMAANEFIEIANVGARFFRQLSFCGSDRHVAAARERSTGGLLDALRHMLEALRSGR
jgi:hypothetical protein